MAIDVHSVLRLVHVLGLAVFLLAHGVAVGVAFRLRKERSREKIAALLELSQSSIAGMGVGWILLLATGIALGVSLWSQNALAGYWFPASIVLFIVLTGIMTPFAGTHYNRVRHALGMRRMFNAKVKDPIPPEKIDAELALVNVWALAAVGFGGIAILSWLMMFHPF